VDTLRGLDLSLAHGESVALVGANGAGKSTLLALLVGLLEPREGDIRVEGERVHRGSLANIRRKVGLLLQDPDDQLFMPTLLEDVAFGPLNLGLSRTLALERAREALARLGISHLEGRPPHRLSAGEKRLGALAAVLSLDPLLLALDEPTSHLDPRARRGLVTLLHELPQARLVVTHDLEFARATCARALVLHEGHIAAEGPAGVLLGDLAALERLGL
jgi:cobalt/nickel transport system ATP-binding protein